MPTTNNRTIGEIIGIVLGIASVVLLALDNKDLNKELEKYKGDTCHKLLEKLSIEKKECTTQATIKTKELSKNLSICEEHLSFRVNEKKGLSPSNLKTITKKYNLAIKSLDEKDLIINSLNKKLTRKEQLTNDKYNISQNINDKSDLPNSFVLIENQAQYFLNKKFIISVRSIYDSQVTLTIANKGHKLLDDELHIGEPFKIQVNGYYYYISLSRTTDYKAYLELIKS